MFARITFIILLVCTLNNAYARKLTKEDVGFECLERHDKVHIAKDGSYVVEAFAKIKILNENGRDVISAFSLDYNSGIEKLELLSAHTINNSKRHPVDPSNIEDKPIASNSLGFDKINRLRIAFQQLKVGSIIEFKYKDTVLVPNLVNHYSKTLFFGQNIYMHKYVCDITSELKLYLEKHHLEKNVSVTEQYKDGVHKIAIKQLRPQCYGNINESGLMSIISDYPWIKFSSSQDWAEFGKPLAQEYDAVLKQKLPKLYKKIQQQALKKRNLIDKINTISSLLNQNIQYLGDWRTIKGKFFPRNLQEVNDTEFADCKDYSTAMVAILRSMGIQADVAFVMRGQLLEEISPKLPSLDNFNHAIAKVYDQDRILWVDPTNPNSLVGINREDISYRHSLVLNLAHPKLEFIPESTPEQNQIISIRDISINQNDTVDLKSTIQRLGLAAVPFTGALLSSTKENIEHVILTNITPSPEDVLKYTMQLPDLNSRIVQDLKFETKLTEKLTTIKTTSGKAYRIQSSSGDIYSIASDAVGSLALGSPMQIKTTCIIRGFKQPLSKNVDCEIDTQWFSFKRTVKIENNDLVLNFIYINKVYAIYNLEFKSQEYKDAVAKLQREYMGGFAIILD